MSFDIRLKWAGLEAAVRDKASEKFPVSVECGSESKVQHQFAAQCNINKIAGGPQGLPDPSLFRDLSDIMDFGSNMEKAARAQQLFESAPVALRKRVGHTIQGLFRFIGDPDNKDECIKFGIFNKPPVVPESDPVVLSKKDGTLKKPVKVSVPLSDESE